MNKRMAAVCLTLIVLLLMFLGFNRRILVQAGVDESQMDSELNTDGLKVSVSVGYEGYVRLGRTTQFYITIEESTDSFSGEIQLQIPDAKGKNIMYSKSVVIEQGEKTTISFELKIVNLFENYNIRLIDTSGKIRYQSEQELDIDEDMSIQYIGLLSDKEAGYGYLTSGGDKVIRLENSGEAEGDQQELENGFDIFDIIIVDHYESENLSQAVREALIDWIKAGGTLVIGTGDYYAETTKAFLEDGVFTVSDGSLIDTTTNFGLNDSKVSTIRKQIKAEDGNLLNYSYETLQLPIYNCKVKDSQVIVQEYDLALVQLLSYGSGRIQIFAMELGKDVLEDHIIAVEIKDVIEDHASLVKKDSLSYGCYSANEAMELYNALVEESSSKAANIIPYVLLILCYLIIAGPMSYLLLRRIRRQSMFWISVPVTAVIFLMIIVTCRWEGCETGARASYINILNYEDGTIYEKGLFSVTPSGNGGYEFELSAAKIQAINDNEYWYAQDASSELALGGTCWNQWIKKSDGLTKISMSQYPSYSTHYYSVESSYETDGTYESNLHYSLDGVYGTFDNYMGKDLEDCFLISSGAIIYLGNVKAYSEATVTQGEGVPLLSSDYYSVSEYICQCMLGQAQEGEDGDTIVQQKSSAINYQIEQYFKQGRSEDLIVGFENVPSSKSYAYELSRQMVTGGIDMMVLPVGVGTMEGENEYQPYLDGKTQMIDGMGNYGEEYRLFSGTATVQYTLPEDRKVTKLYYTDYLNQEFDTLTYCGFSGKIYLFNYQTLQYDAVFAQNKIVNNLEDYINDENQIIVKYKVESELSDYFMTIPYISYQYERRAE